MTVIRHPNNQGVTLSQWRKTAAGGETSVSGTDDFSAGLAYTAGAEQVFVNGVLLERGVDYTASTGTTVTGLTALVAGDIVTVSSPSAFNVANAIPKATITAKGDLLVGTGASTPANLAVGADGTTLVANSSASTGVSWAGPTFAAGRNKFLNSDFSVWQRGTSFSSSTGYTADRWTCIGSYPSTVTQQAFTPGNTITGYESAYYMQVVGSSSLPLVKQRIEDVRTFAGQTVTLSFWAKASVSTGSAFYFLQNFGSGGSASVDNINVYTPTVSTSWARYTTAFTMPSISGKTVGTSSFLEFTAYLSTAASTLSIWGVQLEAGSVATPFTTATGTLQGELTACQRYYYRMNANGASNFPVFGYGFANTTGLVNITCQFPVTMRTKPSAIDTSTLSGFSLDYSNTGVSSLTSITIDTNYSNSDNGMLQVAKTAAFVLASYYRLSVGSSNAAYIGWSAEL